jgi:hypothetical protein
LVDIVLLAVMIFFPLFGLIFSIVLILSKNTHRLVIRVATSGNSKIEDVYWCRAIKDRQEGTVWWKSVFFQKPIKIQEPPSEVLNFSKNGNYWVDVYRLSEDEYIFCRDKGIDAEIIIEKRGLRLADAWKPFSIVERETIVNQYKKANAEKPKDKLTMLINNIPVIVLGLVIIMGIIYAGELTQSFISVGDSAGGIVDKATKLYQSAGGTIQDLNPQSAGGVATSGDAGGG